MLLSNLIPERNYIYFLEDIENKIVKIGFSKDPETRLKTLQGSYPFPTRVLGLTYGNITRENEIHKYFETFRVRSRSEWFYLTDEVREMISVIIIPESELIQSVARFEDIKDFYIDHINKFLTTLEAFCGKK